MDVAPKISVIIRTKNEARWLGEVLGSLFRQTYSNYEIILIDSGSTDETLQIARRFPVQIMEIEPAKFTYGYALNLGFLHSSGPFVACLSGHAVPKSEHWLEHLLKPFVDPQIVGVYGRQLPLSDCDPLEARAIARVYSSERRIQQDVAFFSNSNSMLRRSAWAELPFDESLPYAEDYHWARQMQNRGALIAYEPDAAVYHSHNDNIDQIYQRMTRMSAASTVFDPGKRRWSGVRLPIRLISGSVADVVHVLREGYGLHTIPDALQRRFWIELGSYRGTQEEAILPKSNPVVAVSRMTVKMWIKIDWRAGDVAKKLVKLTGKSKQPIHPKHLIGSEQQHWYLRTLEPTSLVLDVGCNIGAHSLASVEAGHRVVGIDVDIEELKRAIQLAETRGLPFSVAVSQGESTWPFATGQFDAVLLLDVLEHIVRRDEFLREAHRLLKPGGLLFVSIPNRDTSWKQIRRNLDLFDMADPDHKIEYTLESAMSELTAPGFSLVGEPEVTVLDTPFAGIIDAVGGLSLEWYRRLAAWKRNAALQAPTETTGWRFILRRA